MSITSVGTNGNLCVYANSRTHLIVDIVGVWTHISALQPPPPVVAPSPGDQGDTVDPGDPQLGEAPMPGDPGAPDDPNNPATPNNPDGPGQDDSDGLEVSDGCSAAPPTHAPSILLLLGFFFALYRKLTRGVFFN